MNELIQNVNLATMELLMCCADERGGNSVVIAAVWARSSIGWTAWQPALLPAGQA
jgi:hypothetical protein